VTSPLFAVPATVLNRLRRRRRPEVQVARAYPSWLAREGGFPDIQDGPLISVLLPVYNTPGPWLRAAIGSVRRQTYRNWELCITDDASTAPHVAPLLEEAAECDLRIRVVSLSRNSGIASATNAALALASGAFVALLDHDDELAAAALACMAAELARYPDANVLFSDEDQLVDGRRCRPYFKPGWNPDLMGAQNLVSHLGVYRKALIESIGGMRAGFEGSQDYDLALRATASVSAASIRHVPKVLYHWRQHPVSFSAQREAACQQAARAALADALGARATVQPNPDIPQWSRIVYRLPNPPPLVSLILPEGAAAPTDPEYGATEILADTADGASGTVLVFLAGGLTPSRPGWLRELVAQALRPEIGAAGGRLDRPDGRIHAGGMTLHPDQIAQSLTPNSDHDDPGYVGHFLLARSVSAISRDCLALRADLFREAGGFDPRAGVFADIDLCLRLAERGLRCVWTPQARLRYRSLPRRLPDAAAAAFMRASWGKTLGQDPYANPNLMIRHTNLALADRQAAPPRRPAP
jgi:GT2 family glycosyltransferase